MNSYYFVLTLSFDVMWCYGNSIPLDTSSEVQNLKYERIYQGTMNCSSSPFCSPWHYCDEGQCKLGELPPYEVLKFDGGDTFATDSTCVTISEDKQFMEAGFCSYNFAHNLHKLPNNISALNKYMCGEIFNRNGTLCGKCKDGYYPLAYSFDMNCIQCPSGKSNWWKFLLVAFLPLTIFYLIIIFLKVNITSSLLFGFVYAVQNLAHPALIRLAIIVYQRIPRFLLVVRILAVLGGIWNLDFLRSIKLDICLGTDTMQTMALQLAVSVYPFLLMLVSYILIVLYDRNFRPFVIMWRPFQTIFNCFRRNWDIRTSTIDVFSTFFFLSNVNFLFVSYAYPPTSREKNQGQTTPTN